MPQDATCPGCKVSFPVTESRHAFTVACPKCDTEMTVEFKKPANPPEAGQPHYNLLVKPGALATPTAPPTKRKKKDIDEDEDDPRRKGGSAVVVMLSAGFGVLVVLGGLGLTAWVLFGLIDTTPTVTSNRPNNRPSNLPNNDRLNIPPSAPPFNSPPLIPFVPPQPPKPKDTFELRPITGPLPKITPATLPNDPASVDLGKVGQVAVGGGGRYLVMHLPDRGQLTVFDTSAGQFTATVPADTGNAYLTAGLSKVVLAPPNANIFRVYNLPDLAKQYDSSGAGGLRGLAMGARTDGPMLTIGVFGDVKLWEIGGAGVKEVEGAAAKTNAHWHDHGLRAAPDGTAFSTHDGFAAHNRTILLTVQNRKWKTSADALAVPFPGADGRFYGNGIAVDKNYQEHSLGGIGANSGVWFLPSVSSKDHFLKLAPTAVGARPREKKVLAVSVHTGRNSDTVAGGTAVFTDLPEFEEMVDRFRGELRIVPDQHLFLIPEAELLVTITAKRDKLVVRRVAPR